MRDARRFLDKYKRVDAAMDAYYNDPSALNNSISISKRTNEPSTSKLNSLFDKYKGAFPPPCHNRHVPLCLVIWSDPDGDDITMEGTMKLCEDLEVNPDEDCVLYAIAYELKSPRMGEWTRKGWTDGWKILGYVFILFHTKITVKLNVSKAWIPCRR